MPLRVASFNISLSRPKAGQLLADLRAGAPQIRRVAAMVRRVRPDLLLLNEFDHNGEAEALDHFCQHYLAVSDEQGGPLVYPYRYLVPCNTGQLAPVDLDGDGRLSLPGDGLGFGDFPGQYAMVLLSAYPLLEARVRSFARLPWASIPGARLPDAEPGTGLADYYSPAARALLPLSSKNHLDLPVQVGERVLHLLLSHPTPPVFDGAERRNWLRNADEIRLWNHYLDDAQWLVDDSGGRGGLAAGASFVLLGDLNNDPAAGEGNKAAILGLLRHPRLNAAAALGEQVPRSRGALHYAKQQHPIWRVGEPATWTHILPLRLDYVLPSADLAVLDGGVFWPAPDEPGWEWIADARGRQRGSHSSDHRLVWLDLAWGD